MKTVTSVSGGKSSAYVFCEYPSDIAVFALVRHRDKDARFKDKHLKAKVEERIGCEFVGTPEMDDIIHTIFDLEQYTGRKIHWVTGPTFEEVMESRGNYVPNMARRFCTTKMKIDPIFKFLYSEGATPCKMQLGFRAGEERRLLKKMDSCNERGFEEIKTSVKKHTKGRHKGNNKWETFDFNMPVAPLIDDRVYKEDVNRYFKDKPIRFAEMNNCVGCFYRNEALLNTMYQKKPDKFELFNRWEKLNTGTFKKGVTYEDIKNANFTLDLNFDDFNECDSGYCGV